MRLISKILAGIISSAFLLACSIVYAATYLPIQGGTGTNCVPSQGQILLATSSNGLYTCVATSSLGTNIATYFTATSTTATSSFPIASSTNLYAQNINVGSVLNCNTLSALSTASNGFITCNSSLPFYFSNSSATTTLTTGSVLSAYNGYFGNINATSTTSTSTFAGPVSVSGALSLGFSSTTGNITITGQTGSVVYVDDTSTSTSYYVYLPDATKYSGYMFWIKDRGGYAGANPINLVASGTQTIDGTTSDTLANYKGAVLIASDGLNWNILTAY